MAEMGRPPTPAEQVRIDAENDLLTALVQLIEDNRKIHWATRPGGDLEDAALHWWTGRMVQRLRALQDPASALWRRMTDLIAAQAAGEGE